MTTADFPETRVINQAEPEERAIDCWRMLACCFAKAAGRTLHSRAERRHRDGWSVAAPIPVDASRFSQSWIAATMWFGTRNFGSRVGSLVGLVLMLSVGFAFSSRCLLLDGVLAFLVAMSLFTAYEAIKKPARLSEGRVGFGGWLLSGVFVGLAFLTKGPLALVLWLPPVFAMAWLSESFAQLRWWHYVLIGLITSVIVVPWFVAGSFHDAHFISEFFITHNVRRFAGEFHPKPVWYFVPVLLIAGHPWSFLTIPYVQFLFGRSERVRMQRPPIVGFLVLWSGWCFAFFSLSTCKLPT